MIVLWLCIQMALISAASMLMICQMDSFWAVALRSFRVVFWWGRELFNFYFVSAVSLSVAQPRASLWSFFMLCGGILALAAMLRDNKERANSGTPCTHNFKAMLAQAV